MRVLNQSPGMYVLLNVHSRCRSFAGLFFIMNLVNNSKLFFLLLDSSNLYVV